jgi:hypothetical protein
MKGLDVYEWLMDNVFVWFAVACCCCIDRAYDDSVYFNRHGYSPPHYNIGSENEKVL